MLPPDKWKLGCYLLLKSESTLVWSQKFSLIKKIPSLPINFHIFLFTVENFKKLFKNVNFLKLQVTSGEKKFSTRNFI